MTTVPDLAHEVREEDITPAPLADLIDSVADARSRYLALRTGLRTLEAAFHEENAPLIDSVKAAAEVVALTENLAGAALVAHYRRTGEIAPTPGGAVKLFTVYTYDPANALAWAREKQMALVPEQLDVKAFEKIAKATPLPFVQVGQEPRAAISADLDKALGRKAVA